MSHPGLVVGVRFMFEQLARQQQQERTEMAATRIRPGRTVHRTWLSSLDDDSKSIVKANVEALIAEGLAQPEAWDKVYDSAQEPAAQQTSTEGAQRPAEQASEPLVDDKLVEAEQATAAKGSRSIPTRGGKFVEHLIKAVGSLKSSVADDGTLTIVRGEQQKLVHALRAYSDTEIPDHVRWSMESVIGKVRAMFHNTADKGDNVNVRAIDAMIVRNVHFDVVMRSDGSPTYKVGDVTMSAREALKAHTDAASASAA